MQEISSNNTNSTLQGTSIYLVRDSLNAVMEKNPMTPHKSKLILKNEGWGRENVLLVKFRAQIHKISTDVRSGFHYHIPSSFWTVRDAKQHWFNWGQYNETKAEARCC